MIIRVNKADQWGALRCLDVVQDEKPIMALDGAGKPYATGEYESVLMYKLQCDCGKVLNVRGEQFPGKRKMQDCGCGKAFREPTDYSVTVAFTMPFSMRLKLHNDAIAAGMKFSPYLVKVLRAGLDAMEAGDSVGAAPSVESTGSWD